MSPSGSSSSRPAVGIALPTNRTRLTGGELRRAVMELEDAGCDSVWVNDHLALFPVGAEAYPYSDSGHIDWDPYAPQYEALTACTYALAIAERMTVGTSVLILPQRHPVEVAKMGATLADLGGGRFVLGVGAGWSRREMRLLGWDPADRGTRMDEQLDILRTAWGQPGHRPSGAHYEIPADVILEPVPRAVDVPPILVGGNSPGALARVLRRGDGWLAVSPADTRRWKALGATLAELRERAGRPLRAVAKVIVDGFDAAAVADAMVLLTADHWDEVTFEFRKWDLAGACALVRAAR